jgi:ArsR family transcriptional regulator
MANLPYTGSTVNSRLKDVPTKCSCRGKDQCAPKDKDTFRRQAQVLKALANESRLKIVDRLAKGECSVGELTELVGSDQSTVSKHLAVLRSHGIVRDRRDGNVVYYTLMTPCVVSFFACATQVLKERD